METSFFHQHRAILSSALLVILFVAYSVLGGPNLSDSSALFSTKNLCGYEDIVPPQADMTDWIHFSNKDHGYVTMVPPDAIITYRGGEKDYNSVEGLTPDERFWASSCVTISSPDSAWEVVIKSAALAYSDFDCLHDDSDEKGNIWNYIDMGSDLRPDIGSISGNGQYARYVFQLFNEQNSTISIVEYSVPLDSEGEIGTRPYLEKLSVVKTVIRYLHLEEGFPSWNLGEKES